VRADPSSTLPLPEKSEFQIAQKQKTHLENQELTLDSAGLWDDCEKKTNTNYQYIPVVFNAKTEKETKLSEQTLG
jgi:hypothetical protein